MKNLSFLKTLFVLFFAATVSVFSQNYEIGLTLNTRNDTVMLGHYFAKGDRMYPDDTLVLKNGKGVLRGNRKLPKGVYFLINDKKRLFDFIIGDHQQFGIVADTADFVNHTKFTSSPDNDIFLQYQRHMIERRQRLQQLDEQYRNASSDAERNDIRVKQSAFNKESLQYIDKLIEDNRHLYVGKFVNSLIPIEARLPEPPRNEQGRITDSTYVYRWYRAHFFDNLNIFDPDMLRTQSYEEKLFTYLTRVIPQHTDTICAELDKILTKARANDEIFRAILVNVFNHFAGSKTLRQGELIPENVKLYLAEKWYIPYAAWSSEEHIEQWKKEVKDNKMNRMGHPASPIEPLLVLPPEHFKAAAMDTAIKNDIYAGRVVQDFRKEMKSKLTVLFFWDINCGHCKTAIQELFHAWEELKNNDLQIITVQVVATKEAKGRWIDFVNEHNLFGWVNAWSPYAYSAENHYRESYNLAVVPKMYLLDENSVIVLKNIVPEQLKEIIPKN